MLRNFVGPSATKWGLLIHRSNILCGGKIQLVHQQNHSMLKVVPQHVFVSPSMKSFSQMVSRSQANRMTLKNKAANNRATLVPSLYHSSGGKMMMIRNNSTTSLFARGVLTKSPLHKNMNSMVRSNMLYMQLGSVTHLSSFGGGGGGRRPFFGGNNLSRGLGLASAAAVLFGKGKYILGALKLTKFASLGSMVLSVGAYSMIFGLPYACGMVGLILVHEAGHALVMLQRGIPMSPMVFIPFMGAVIAMKKQPQDAWENALVAFGGPVLGSMGAGAVAVAGSMTESQLLYALADFGYMVNLFNLMPLGSMDGGRITDALSPYAGVLGLGIGGALVFNGVVHNPIMYLVLLSGGYQTFQRFYDPHHVPPNYYRISNAQRAAITGGYFGLIAAIFGGMAANQRYQKPPEVIQREMANELSWDMR